jgi:hypothetical protein
MKGKGRNITHPQVRTDIPALSMHGARQRAFKGGTHQQLSNQGFSSLDSLTRQNKMPQQCLSRSHQLHIRITSPLM